MAPRGPHGAGRPVRCLLHHSGKSDGRKFIVRACGEEQMDPADIEEVFSSKFFMYSGY